VRNEPRADRGSAPEARVGWIAGIIAALGAAQVAERSAHKFTSDGSDDPSLVSPVNLIRCIKLAAACRYDRDTNTGTRQMELDEAIAIDDPDRIELFRLLALRGALKLEIKGLKRRGRSAYAIVKDELGVRGSKQLVLRQLENHILYLKIRKK
tara:strand:- start:3445 stop:3903 length:459 start_codon:yes stop_codon:yes gene_type:complete